MGHSVVYMYNKADKPMLYNGKPLKMQNYIIIMKHMSWVVHLKRRLTDLNVIAYVFHVYNLVFILIFAVLEP